VQETSGKPSLSAVSQRSQDENAESGIRESNPYPTFDNTQPPHDVIANPETPFAQTFARETQVDADLRLILDRWPVLPEAIRAGIVAMVKAASRGG
jgi:hypothetical protein